jgi:hypothetical protein
MNAINIQFITENTISDIRVILSLNIQDVVEKSDLLIFYLKENFAQRKTFLVEIFR